MPPHTGNKDRGCIPACPIVRTEICRLRYLKTFGTLDIGRNRYRLQRRIFEPLQKNCIIRLGAILPSRDVWLPAARPVVIRSSGARRGAVGTRHSDKHQTQILKYPWSATRVPDRSTGETSMCSCAGCGCT